MEAIVLAGGFGTRLRSVVSEVPKPMAPILGKPFLDHLMDYWEKNGIDHFILSIGYLSGQIVDYFNKNPRKKSQISFVIEAQPLGTGGAIAESLSKMKDIKKPFWILNGDTFFLLKKNDCEKMLTNMKNNNMVMSLRKVPNNARYDGVIVGENHLVEQFGGSKSNLVNGGVLLLSSSLASELVLNKGKVFSFEKDIVPGWVAQNFVNAFVFDSPFLDIGVPEAYSASDDFIKRNMSEST